MVKVLRSENGSSGLSERASYSYDYRGLCFYKSAERGVEYREYTADGRLIYVEKDGSKVDYVYNSNDTQNYISSASKLCLFQKLLIASILFWE